MDTFALWSGNFRNGSIVSLWERLLVAKRPFIGKRDLLVDNE
jgi:hypothetical protein